METTQSVKEKMAAKKKRKRASGKWMAAMSMAALLAIGAATLTLWSFRRHATPANAAVGQMATRQAGAGAGTVGASTSKYNHEVAQANAAGAKRASVSGRSFMPTPSAGSVPITLTNLDVPTHRKISAPASEAAAPVIAQPPQPIVSVRVNRKTPAGKFMDTVMAQWMRAQIPVVAVWADKRAKSGMPAGESSATKQVVVGGMGSKKPNPAPVKVGHIYYAVNLLAANSDQPGTPVLAEVVAGTMTGARFIGGFRTEKNRLLLEFSEIAFHGKVWKVSGFGVDPATAQPSLATGVDHHYLERWGGLIASSFLEGFGRAVQQSGTTMSRFAGGNGISTVYSTPPLNVSVESEIALGKVGQKLGVEINKGFDRKPTVYLRKGVAVGVLVLKP